MSENKDKIFEKLRKLMNLKESALSLNNEGEANAAASGITRLLMEYNLTENDIPEQEKIDNPIVSEEIPYRTKVENGPWYKSLVSVLSEYNMCRCLIISCRKDMRLTRERFQVVGRKKNVEVVLYLISFLSNQFIKVGREKYPDYKRKCIYAFGRTPLSLNRFMKSFLIGCVSGLSDKLEETKQSITSQTDIAALVLSTKGEIDDFLKDEKIGKARNNKSIIDKMSAVIGAQIGYNIEVNKGVYAQTVDEGRMLS